MRIGVPKETLPGETRVAAVPDSVARFCKAGLEVVVQAGAGAAAGYLDADYAAKGAKLAADAAEVFGQADIVLKVRKPSDAELDLFKPGAVLVAILNPLSDLKHVELLAERKLTALALDTVPRITRAQSMDVLSSQATVAGYKAVLLAANELPRMFPMLMTAAGTLAPARVLVLGAGVAGLMAIGAARRMGAMVEAYDVRPAVKEQVQSLGARFVELPSIVKDGEAAGGYARALTEEEQARQRELLGKHMAGFDVVISTAAVPGRRAPLLVDEAAVKGMRPGSVIVDLAAESGGNCALTVPGETVVRHGVSIVGHNNYAALVPFHASQMFARNIQNLVLELWKDGNLKLDPADEIVAGVLITRDGEVVHPEVKKRLAARVTVS